MSEFEDKNDYKATNTTDPAADNKDSNSTDSSADNQNGTNGPVIGDAPVVLEAQSNGDNATASNPQNDDVEQEVANGSPPNDGKMVGEAINQEQSINADTTKTSVVVDNSQEEQQNATNASGTVSQVDNTNVQAQSMDTTSGQEQSTGETIIAQPQPESTETDSSPDTDLLVTFKVIVNKSGVFLIGLESTPAKLEEKMKETQIDLNSDNAIGKIQEIITSKYGDKILPEIEKHLQTAEETSPEPDNKSLEKPAETSQGPDESSQNLAETIPEPDKSSQQPAVETSTEEKTTRTEIPVASSTPGATPDQQSTDAAVNEEITDFENNRFKPKYIITDKTICVTPNNSRRIRNPDVKCSISKSEKGYSCEFPTLFTTPSCIESSYEDNNSTPTPTTTSTKPSVMSGLRSHFNRQPEDGLSKMLKPFWKITRKYNGIENNPGVLKLWLLEYEELLRNYHDVNFKAKNRKSYDKTKLLSKTTSSFGTSKGYETEIKKKLTEFDEYMKAVEKFKLSDKLTYQKAPEVNFPDVIVGYKLGKDGSGKISLFNHITNKINENALGIVDIYKNLTKISDTFNEINSTTALFFEKIQIDLYIYYAFCKLYGFQVDSSYDDIISNIQKNQIYIISQTSRFGIVIEKIKKDAKILSSNNPTEVELKNDTPLKPVDVNGLIQTVYTGYKTIMGKFYTQHKQKLDDFKKSLKEVNEVIKSTFAELTLSINSSNWDACKKSCDDFHKLEPQVDAKYQILLKDYDRTKSELPMCRSNKMQTLTTMVKSSATSLVLGTGSVIIAGGMTVLTTGFVVFVILPAVGGGLYSFMNRKGGSSKNRRTVKRPRTHTHKRNV